MPLEQTITIINNSGKIISTGKHLVSIFKGAKASYQDKRAQVKSERSIQRAQTFDQSRSVYRHDNNDYDRALRRSFDDGYSETGSRRSSRSKRSHSKRYRDSGRSRPALTESNLQTLSEVSSMGPSKAPIPNAYRSPYAETLPLDRAAMSKMDLTQVDMRSLAVEERRRSMDLPRRRSEPDFGERRDGREIDMNLAYGNVPPDLASRDDLDPIVQEQSKENQAKNLIHQVENLLDEAHCVHHTATSIISHLQANPEAAAAVALTLAELSSLITKMSPAFLGFLKGGSPAVFALLASPQFLIGTGIAVGVTIVMFGGWKIVKKVKEAHAAKAAMAMNGIPMDHPGPPRTQSEFSAGIDEALVLEEELSTIETWRRGIASVEENESADVELITPEAERANRERRGREDFDTRSRKSSKTHKSHRPHKSRRDDREVPERKSSRNATESASRDDRGKKSTKRKEKSEIRAIEDGKSRRSDNELEVTLRPRAQRQGSNMLKAMFKNKKDKEKDKDKELVLAH